MLLFILYYILMLCACPFFCHIFHFDQGQGPAEEIQARKITGQAVGVDTNHVPTQTI